MIENMEFISYDLPDFKIQYGTTRHGNGKTFNIKTNNFLICDPDEYNKLYEYNSKTFKIEKIYTTSNKIPIFRSIGYDYNNNL